MQANQNFLSPTQLARYLSVPVATIYGWRHQGKGPPAAKLGNHLRYRKADVDDWIDSNTSNTSG